MLAYVFSHRPAPDADVAEYEAVLREFHEVLAGSHLAGFISSRTYRERDRYSDWYLLEDSRALDGLNEAAVTGSRATSHHAAARMAVDGVGRLLSLAGGNHDPDALVETHLAKPPGMTYAELYAGVRPVVVAGAGALWRRMMVLGPPPEFSVTSPSPLELPGPIRAEVVRRTAI